MTPDQHGYVKCESCGCWRPYGKTFRTFDYAGWRLLSWCSDVMFCANAKAAVKP